MGTTSTPSLELLERLTSIGVAPTDAADTRVLKGALTLTAASIAVLASAWTLIYLALEQPYAARIT